MAKWMWLTVDEFAVVVGVDPDRVARAISNRELLQAGVFTGKLTLYAVLGEDGEYRIPVALHDEVTALMFLTRTRYERYCERGDEVYGVPLPWRAVKRLCWGDTE